MTTSSDQNVDIIDVGFKKIFLVGTAHISQESADLAEEVIRREHPDSVAIELCDSRYQSLSDPNRWRNTDIISVIRSGKTYLLLTQLILVGFQKRLGDQLNIKPGAEMVRAAKVAEDLHINLVLADRDVRTTLKRTWASVGFISMCKLVAALVASVFSPPKISKEEIERMKSSDALESMMKELSDTIPEVRSSLIDERDQYLASCIQEAPGNKIVAIVGAGHIAGIKRYLNTEIDRVELDKLPPPSRVKQMLNWLIPTVIVALFIYGFFASGKGMTFDMLKAWCIVNGTFAGIGCALALPHPITILSAIIAAPFTAIHPFIASGWVAGLVEAMIKKPVVSDLESIPQDMTSLKGVWHNRLSKILLVVALTNIGGAIGMALGVPIVASYVQ